MGKMFGIWKLESGKKFKTAYHGIFVHKFTIIFFVSSYLLVLVLKILMLYIPKKSKQIDFCSGITVSLQFYQYNGKQLANYRHFYQDACTFKNSSKLKEVEIIIFPNRQFCPVFKIGGFSPFCLTSSQLNINRFLKFSSMKTIYTTLSRRKMENCL